jgi:LysM repeat protein
MRRISLLLLLLSCAAVFDAAAQAAPSTRRPPADTVRMGRAAADSIRMAEEGEVVSIDALEEEEAPAAADTVPVPADGPYTRAAGTGPFTVQASGEPAPRPARSEVVWVNARPARPAAADTAGTGTRVASGSTTRRDTASASRPAARDTARTGQGQRVASGSTTRRDTASASRPAPRDTARTGQGQRVASGSTTRRDTVASTTRRAPRDTVTVRRGDTGASTSGRTGSGASTTTSGRTGSGASTTTSGRTGSGTTTPAATGRPRAHTVATGETFYGIARRYGVTAAQLRALNPDVDVNELEVGDVLRLPAGARDSRAPAQPARTGSGTPARPSTAPTQPRGSRTHTVAQGETLFGIARRYGVTVAALREANELETDQVRTGQRLVIPPAR